MTHTFLILLIVLINFSGLSHAENTTDPNHVLPRAGTVTRPQTSAPAKSAHQLEMEKQLRERHITMAPKGTQITLSQDLLIPAYSRVIYLEGNSSYRNFPVGDSEGKSALRIKLEGDPYEYDRLIPKGTVLYTTPDPLSEEVDISTPPRVIGEVRFFTGIKFTGAITGTLSVGPSPKVRTATLNVPTNYREISYHLGKEIKKNTQSPTFYQAQGVIPNANYLWLDEQLTTLDAVSKQGKDFFVLELPRPQSINAVPVLKPNQPMGPMGITPLKPIVIELKGK